MEKADSAYKEKKLINFFSAKKVGDTLYKLHMSVTANEGNWPPLTEGRFRFFMTKGFLAGVGPTTGTKK